MVNTDGRPTIACGVTRREQFPSMQGLANRLGPSDAQRRVSRVDDIIAFEQGELDDDDALQLIADMVKDGTVWHLQGSYGRLAAQLILAGKITETGEVID